MHELARFRSLVRSLSWVEIEFARPDVRNEHVEGLVQLYWTLEDWPQRVALVQLVQDRRTHPALEPVMLDVLRARSPRTRRNVELTKAAALRLTDSRYDPFMTFYEDRTALPAAVREVLAARGSSEE
ncbi:hypothetical protein [Kitasatospora sp. DSM 101779]|uniref:hypothetical protein n=1 Tax=Kitasatospora sp. DSM 101779 TaxID=2853165 RepID=UPI0021DB7501|nr:hypothetical protein [Kitasatospora sp. DSM 101779]MCU7827007.1 hypothetical protein [Kitasatospora sp. DSM 101779]